MNEDWIPSLESESGYTDIWLAVDSLMSDSPSAIAMEAQVYVNDLAGGVGVGILKVLEKAMQNTVNTYTRWYGQTTNQMNQYINQIHHVNAGAIKEIAKQTRTMQQTLKIAEKQARNRKLSAEERENANLQAQQYRDLIKANQKKQQELMGKIYVPARVMKLYEEGKDASYREYGWLHDLLKSYEGIIHDMDDPKSHRFGMDVDDVTKEIIKLRNEVNKRHEEVSEPVRVHRQMMTDIKAIQALKNSKADLVQLPLTVFVAIDFQLKENQKLARVCIDRLEEHLGTIRQWLRSPSDVDGDQLKLMREEQLFMLPMITALANWLQIFLNLAYATLECRDIGPTQ